MFLAATEAERYAIGEHAVADRRQDRRRYRRLRLCHEITNPLGEGRGGLRGRRRPGARPTKVLTRRSRNQKGRAKSKSWSLPQSASKGLLILNETHCPKYFLPENAMIQWDRY